MLRIPVWLSAIILFAVFCSWARAGDSFPDPLSSPAPGPYIAPECKDFAVESFSSKDRLVAAYYFYWYDVYSGQHITDADGTDALQDHPHTMEDFSFLSVRWHKEQIEDMMTAGIDIMLPIYWGDSGNIPWSQEGIRKLVEAQEALIAEGKKPPKIGLFFDTSSLMVEGKYKPGGQNPDLTTPEGKALFYILIRDFFSLAPPRLWAAIDGRPVVWLYSAGFASAHDQSSFDFVYEHFAADFGGLRPYIVRERSWNGKTESVYAWGAALNGANFFGAAALGPGYNDSAVPGRTTPIRDRDQGRFYNDSWVLALAAGLSPVVIETWNEFHEGTDIANSKEYGRSYIEATAFFSNLYHNPQLLSDPKMAGLMPQSNLCQGCELSSDPPVPLYFGKSWSGSFIIAALDPEAKGLLEAVVPSLGPMLIWDPVKSRFLGASEIAGQEEKSPGLRKISIAFKGPMSIILTPQLEVIRFRIKTMLPKLDDADRGLRYMLSESSIPTSAAAALAQEIEQTRSDLESALESEDVSQVGKVLLEILRRLGTLRAQVMSQLKSKNADQSIIGEMDDSFTFFQGALQDILNLIR